MWELFKAGGPIMWPLLALAILALGIILERLWSLRRATILPAGVTDQVLTLVREQRVGSEHIASLRTHSPLGRVLATVLTERKRPHDILVSRTEDTGRQVVHGLSRWLNTLGTIAIVSPLVGLLGTVTGMIRMFLVITEFGVGDASRLAGGIGEALMTTAFGLVVAIPAYILHRYFRGLIQDYAVTMAHEAARVVEAIESQPRTAAATAGAKA